MMKTMNRILFRSAGLLPTPAFWLVVLALLWGTGVSAQDLSAKLNVRKQYPVSRETTVEVQNKYGTIQVVTWNKDSVAMEVDISLTESSASRLRKLKDDISIDFTRTSKYILAKTKFKSESGRISSELKSISNTLSGSNKHVEINYTLYIPAYLDLVLNNKFGDIYLDNLQGSVDIELSNGVLKASQLDGVSNMSLSFANGMIKSLGSGTLNLSYSEIELGDAGQLDLTSKSSKLQADSVNVLKINSRRDNLYFQRVEYFYGNSNFTQVWINDFLRESDVHMKYGKLTIEHVFSRFSKIYVESEYTDISLYFDKNGSYAFDILHHEKTVLKLPVEQVSSEKSFDGDEHFRTIGTKGGRNPEGKVAIDALQKCYINLSMK
ncbi:MAG: hypothetical protein V2B15_00055 [Bacteroidota bacterium]